MNSYDGKTVLIAGGTRGIGLATGIEFAQKGAQVWLTHRWGSASEAEVQEKFLKAGAKYKPRIVQADVTSEEDTAILLEEIRSCAEKIDVFVCSASSLLRIQSLESYKKRSFLKTLEYCVWPMASYPLEIQKVFGHFPRYIVGLSTFSTVSFHSHYDFAAAGKSALETLVKYLAVRLRPYGSTVNLIRPPFVDTQAVTAVFGAAKAELIKKVVPSAACVIEPEEVAKAIFGICSGYFDHVSGQTITLDQGGGFVDNTMGILERDDLRKTLAAQFGLLADDEL